MISDKQLKANGKNAKLGGVKTEEGKEVSKYNAQKHGLLSKEVLLKDENEDELIELGRKLRAELKPTNEIERFFVDRIIANQWRLKRALKAEREMIQDSLDEVTYSSHPKTLGGVFSHDLANYDSYGKFSRYETSIEKGMYKALHELQRMQSPQNGEE